MTKEQKQLPWENNFAASKHRSKKKDLFMDSNLINGVKPPQILIAFLCSLLFFAGCDERQCKNVAEQRDLASAPWIEEAVAIARKIPADIHKVERDRTLAKAAVVASETGLTSQTVAAVESLNSWRKGDLYARLARSRYLENRNAEGDKLLGAARQLLAESDYEDWQKSRITLAIEQAGLAQGRQTGAATLADIEPADQAKLLPGLVQHNVSHSNLVEMLEQLESSTNQVLDIDSAAGVVDTYLVLYRKSQTENQTQRSALRDRILDGIDSVFRGLHAAIACEKLIDFCNAAWDADDRDFAMRLSEMTARRLPTLRTDMRLPIQLRYAGFLTRSDRTAQAMRQVENAAAGIGDESVIFSDRPVLLAECGVLCWLAGEQDRARQFLGQAVEELNAMKNARPRAVAAVDVTLLLARNRIEDMETLRAMRELNGNLSAPW